MYCPTRTGCTKHGRGRLEAVALHPQPGPDLSRLLLPCPRARRQWDMAGRPSLFQSPRDTTTCTTKFPSTTSTRGGASKETWETASSLASHIVSADPGYSVPGYSLERQFGEVRILRRDQNEPPVRPWIDHAPVILSNRSQRIMRQMDPDAPSQPANFGIRFADREGP